MPAKRMRTITTFGQAFPGITGSITVGIAEIVSTFKGMFRGLFKRMF